MTSALLLKITTDKYWKKLSRQRCNRRKHKRGNSHGVQLRHNAVVGFLQSSVLHSTIGHIPAGRRTETAKALKLPSYDENEKSYIEMHVDTRSNTTREPTQRKDHAFRVPFLEYVGDTGARIKREKVKQNRTKEEL